MEIETLSSIALEKLDELGGIFQAVQTSKDAKFCFARNCVSESELIAKLDELLASEELREAYAKSFLGIRWAGEK